MNQSDIIIELEKLGYKDFSIVKLQGDASTREFYRFSGNDYSYVLMKEEAFDSSTYVKVYEFLNKININLAKIINLVPEKKIIVLNDLGDKDLFSLKNNKEINVLYFKAIDLIKVYQNNDLKNVYPLTFSFTYEKFIEELQMSLDYYTIKYKKKKSVNTELVDSFFKDLVATLINQKFKLLHRDYHSKNLMVMNNEIYMIDFQDARMGPYTYDLASLVIDPYFNMDERLSNDLINYYFNKMCFESFDDFYNDYLVSYLQRGIKILGTFSYQKFEKSNNSYIEYIEPTINKILNVKKFFPKWEEALEEIL